MTRLVARLAAILVAAASLIGPPAWAESKTLRISSIPDEVPTELQRKFGALAQYLEAAIQTVEDLEVSDYLQIVAHTFSEAYSGVHHDLFPFDPAGYSELDAVFQESNDFEKSEE